MVARGYASLSFLHNAAEYINELDVPAYIYHLGDFDPSGVNAGEKIEETLREMAPNAEIYFERIARRIGVERVRKMVARIYFTVSSRGHQRPSGETETCLW